MPHTWPLIGRRTELAEIEEALGGNAGGIVLSGPSGVGKTRLLHEALVAAIKHGHPSGLVTATSSAAVIPFGAFAPLLPEEIVPADQEPPLSRLNVLRLAAKAVAERLSEDSEHLPRRIPTLGVDDVHLLDPMSAALLHHLVVEEMISVLASVRVGVPAPDAIVALWKEELVRQVEVPPLTPDETAELLETALDGQVASSTAYRLWKTTQGNPLLLRELVRAAKQNNVLAFNQGVWRWQSEFPVSPRLTETVETQLEPLRDSERHTVEVMAVAESLRTSVLASICGPRAVALLADRHLLVEETNGADPTVRLAHPVYGETIRAAMPVFRVKTIKKQLANALEGDDHRHQSEDLQAAVWRIESGGDASPELLIERSQHCLQILDFALAERLARAAVEAGGGIPALLVLAEASIGRGRADEGEKILLDVEPLADDDEMRTTIATLRADNLFWRLQRPGEALEVLGHVESIVTDSRRRDEVAADRGTLLLFSGQTKAGNELLTRLVTTPDVSEAAKLRAAPALVWGLSIAGRPDTALSLVRAVQTETIDGASDWFSRTWLDVNLGVPDLFAGRLIAAESTLLPLYEKVAREGPEMLRGLLGFATGHVARLIGKPASAVRRLREAVSFLRDNDYLGTITACLAELAHALALSGDVASAENALAEAESRISPSIRMGEAYMGLARAWTSVARGEISTAIGSLSETSSVVRDLEQDGLEAMVLYDIVRLGKAPLVNTRLKKLAEEIEGNMVVAFSEHAEASTTADVVGLDRASLTFERMGALLYAAEAAAEASRYYRREGQKASGFQASARANELQSECDGVVTPALANLEPLPITPREREVATMAALGASNREIAERLFLSVRTIHNHLHRAYKKLGVTGRSELSDILIRHSRSKDPPAGNSGNPTGA